MLNTNCLYVIAISNSMYDNTDLFGKKDFCYISKKEDLTFEFINSIKPKYLFFPHWSYIIPKEIYENFNCIIFHMTDLPFGRGGSPLQNLISREIYNTKISAIKCEKTLDSGDIYLKKDFSIKEGSAYELYIKCSKIVSKMINEIIEKNITPIPQEGEPVIFKRRTEEDSNISNIYDLDKIYDYIRMLDAPNYPNAFLKYNNMKYKFRNAKYINGKIMADVEITNE